MPQFDNNVVVVTGAAGALGKAVADYFKQHGAGVAHLDVSEEILAESFPDQSERTCLYLAVDLTDRESCQRGIAQIAEQFGRVDIIANIAGGFMMGDPLHETSDATWDFLFNLNTRSILNTSAGIIPLMLRQGGGKVINIAANGALSGAATMGPYIASKSAVMRLTESMALELRDSNINVNCILSVIDTPRHRKDMPDADHSKWVKPSSIAEVIGFLASDVAKDIHGASLPVTGLS